jgi:predicted amidophosphoribosyltransferase
MKYCPECKEYRGKGDFCHECGTKLEEYGHCPKCKYELHPVDKYCPDCGTKVERTSNQHPRGIPK